MNLSLIPISPPARQKMGTLAKVYTKDGRSLRVPLRTPQSTTCTTCSQNPERQFIRWFTRQSAANPGFPVMVKSILLVSNQQPCANCQRILTSFLYRHNLAGKLRLGTRLSRENSSQQEVSTDVNGEFDPESDQELSRNRRARPRGQTRTVQRKRVLASRPLMRPRGGRSVVHILRQPLITGYQPDTLPDSVPNTQPACNCAHSASAVEEPIVETPGEPTEDTEPATSDEVGAKGRPRRAPAAFTPEAAAYLRHERGLTQLANQIKRLGQMAGATVEIALARLADGRRLLVAGINSNLTARWTRAQLAELKRLGIERAPQTVRMEKGPHAEENIAAHLITLGARGERWSKAVVGNGTKRAYVCAACRAMIQRVGGIIED